MPYYIIEDQYIGPNYTTKDINNHHFLITTVPGRTNMSREERTSGWLGTTHDYYRYAHGEYDTLDDAREALDEMTGDEYRLVEEDSDAFWELTPDGEVIKPIEVRRVGKYEELSVADSCDECYSLYNEITDQTTDEEIDKLVDSTVEFYREEYQSLLNEEAVREMLIERRDELIIAQEID